jgi:2-(1,2-epoxy-1,2-dihydrophenyl)acetyl-CoA isomerase
MSFIDGLKLEKQGCALVMTMSNPGRRNAFYAEMRARMITAMRESAADNDIRVIILTGADGHFCVGADLQRSTANANAPKTPMTVRENMKQVHNLLRGITQGSKPFIAAVEGDAFGAGLSMTAASDRVFVSKTARFGAAFTKIGIIPDTGLMYTLPQRVGMACAKDIMFIGEPFSGEKAFQIGLADELVEPGKALEAAIAYAQKFADLAPTAIGLTKAALANGITSIDDVMRVELDYLATVVMSADASEGILAFKEKRKPKFTGN